MQFKLSKSATKLGNLEAVHQVLLLSCLLCLNTFFARSFLVRNDCITACHLVVPLCKAVDPGLLGYPGFIRFLIECLHGNIVERYVRQAIRSSDKWDSFISRVVQTKVSAEVKILQCATRLFHRSRLGVAKRTCKHSLYC